MKSRAFQYALFPLVLAGSIATVVVLVELGLSVPKACFLTVFLSAAVIAGLERLWPRVDGVDLLADSQSPRDFAHTILVSRVGGPLGALAVVTVIGLLSSDDSTALVSWWPEALPFTVEVLAAWLVFG
ncbi:MAG TPA: hypothetical protein VIY72_15335, partial [Acidimicrobiales bacterium]